MVSVHRAVPYFSVLPLSQRSETCASGVQTDELPDAPIVGNPMWYIGAYGRDLLSCPERLILAVNGFKFGGFMQLLKTSPRNAREGPPTRPMYRRCLASESTRSRSMA